jgi:hypothetical protein
LVENNRCDGQRTDKDIALVRMNVLTCRQGGRNGEGKELSKGEKLRRHVDHIGQVQIDKLNTGSASQLTSSRAYHKVPSTSKTIPFRCGALCTLGLFGSSGANLRGRLGIFATVREGIDTLKDVPGVEKHGVNLEDSINHQAIFYTNDSTALKRDERWLTKSGFTKACP